MKQYKDKNTKYIFSYVSKELHKEVKEFCAKNDTTIVALLEKLLRKEIDNAKPIKPILSVFSSNKRTSK